MGADLTFCSVPGHSHETIAYAIDAGASIVVPQVDTVEQARHIVAAVKYGAKIGGKRSAPPGRFVPGVTDIRIDPSISFHQNINRQAAIVIQIESYEGIKNLDDILTEVGEHIDSVWLGSLDARVSMNMSGGGVLGQEPEWKEAVALYESTLRKHNKPASGLAFGSPEMKNALGRGRSFMVTGADIYALMGESAQLSDMRERFQQKDHSEIYTLL